MAEGWILQDSCLPPHAHGSEHGRANLCHTLHQGLVGIKPKEPYFLSFALTAVEAEVQIRAMHFENVRN